MLQRGSELRQRARLFDLGTISPPAQRPFSNETVIETVTAIHAKSTTSRRQRLTLSGPFTDVSAMC